MLTPVPPPAKILKDWREALELVKTRSPNYIQANAQIEVARGSARMALSAALPRLTANAGLNHHMLTEDKEGFGPEPITLPDPRSNWNVGAGLRVPILAARSWYDYETSKQDIKRAELSRDDAERLVIAGLAETMVSVLTAERLAEVTRVNLAAALSTLDLNRRRARLGAGSAVDVLRSKQEVARSRAQLVDADEGLHRAREALGQALGYAEPFGITPSLKMDQLRQDARDTCTQGTDATNRADVRAAAAGAAIAKRNVKSVMYSHLPTIDFVSNLNHNSIGGRFVVQTTWTIGAALTWHLYDGGRRYGERQMNEALLEQQQQTTLDAERQARIQATQATRGVRVARAGLEIAEESQKIAEDNAKLARAKFINGSGTSFDMVDTQRTARQTVLDVTVKEFELLRAEIIAFLALASCDL
jgi:outer membrane protein TolC